VLLVVGGGVGAAYVIVEWVYSDAPTKPRPWQRRRRERHPDSESPP
jgi:hypothetical protein